MNERIQQLAKQSGFGVRQNQIYTSKLEHFPITEDIEKFAQLIAQEVLDVIENERYTLYEPVVEKVKQHFGIEE